MVLTTYIQNNKRKIIIAVIVIIVLAGLVIYYKRRIKKSNSPNMPTLRPYIYESKIKDNKEEFILGIENLTNYLGIDNPNSLLAVMNLESGLNPKAQNTTYPFANGYATGLIQFTPDTAKYLGTSVESLYATNNVGQLEYVKKYFSPFRGKIKSFTDLYLTTFFPAALGKADSYVIETSKISAQSVAKSNPSFDLDKNGAITVGEFKKAVLGKIPDYQKFNLK